MELSLHLTKGSPTIHGSKEFKTKMFSKHSSAELLVLIVFTACISASGCDRKATSESNAASGQDSEQPSVAKSNTDPVASLRQLTSEIPADKSFELADEDIQAWRTNFRMLLEKLYDEDKTKQAEALNKEFQGILNHTRKLSELGRLLSTEESQGIVS